MYLAQIDLFIGKRTVPWITGWSTKINKIVILNDQWVILNFFLSKFNALKSTIQDTKYIQYSIKTHTHPAPFSEQLIRTHTVTVSTDSDPTHILLLAFCNSLPLLPKYFRCQLSS